MRLASGSGLDLGHKAGIVATVQVGFAQGLGTGVRARARYLGQTGGIALGASVVRSFAEATSGLWLGV